MISSSPLEWVNLKQNSYNCDSAWPQGLKLVEEVYFRQGRHIIFMDKELSAKAYAEAVPFPATPNPTKTWLHCRGIHKAIAFVVSTGSLESVAETGLDPGHHRARSIACPVIREHLSEARVVVCRNKEISHTSTQIMMFIEHISVWCFKTDNGKILVGKSNASPIAGESRQGFMRGHCKCPT